MKPTANFKLSKQTKRTLALTKFKSEEQRSQWKRAMIDAELTAAMMPKLSKNKDRADK